MRMCVVCFGRARCAALKQNSERYAASTYRLCDAFYEQRESRQDSVDALYTHLIEAGSLSFNDTAWNRIMVPDHTGFRGFTCSALVTCDNDPNRMNEYGHMAYQPAYGRLAAVESPVVKFEAKPDDEHGAHSAVLFDKHYGAFPPNSARARPGMTAHRRIARALPCIALPCPALP